MSALLLASPPAPAADTSSAQAQSSQATTTAAPKDPDTSVTAPDPDTSGAEEPRPRRHRGPSIRIDSDHDFESFRRAMDTAPWIVAATFLLLGSLFLTPIFLLIGIVWYKLRKTRMQNEALLRLAETGAISPAQAVESVYTGEMPEAGAPVAAKPGATPYQQVVATRRRAIWSDLRKGVILGSIGLSMVAYSMFEHGSANWPGLALLFVGIAYIVLWKLGDRHLDEAAGR